jgi:hypothetical protein
VERNNRDAVDALKDDKMLQNMTYLWHLADTYPIAMWIGKLINKVIGMSEDNGAEFPSYGRWTLCWSFLSVPTQDISDQGC